MRIYGKSTGCRFYSGETNYKLAGRNDGQVKWPGAGRISQRLLVYNLLKGNTNTELFELGTFLCVSITH